MDTDEELLDGAGALRDEGVRRGPARSVQYAGHAKSAALGWYSGWYSEGAGQAGWTTWVADGAPACAGTRVADQQRTMSRIDSNPMTSAPSTTIRCRKLPWTIAAAAASMVQSRAANTTSCVQWSAATSLSGLSPAETDLWMSRPVRMPTPA